MKLRHQPGLQRMDAKGVTLRPACMDDCRLVWEWANDPEVRAASFSTDPIPWTDHVKWFENKLRDPNCFFFIALDENGSPVGQVRLDSDESGQAEINICLGKDKRGLGYGPIMVGMAVEEIFARTSVSSVHAFIKAQNQASIKVFEKAGFRRQGVDIVKGNQAVHYFIERSNK
ncbi:MAG: GNAT family N-acetyltransferase [Thiobacillaceae bacterium]